jgi:hypothetical protein
VGAKNLIREMVRVVGWVFHSNTVLRVRGEPCDSSRRQAPESAQGEVLDSESYAGNKRSTDDDQERVHHPQFVSPLDRKEVILPEPAPVWVLS